MGCKQHPIVSTLPISSIALAPLLWKKNLNKKNLCITTYVKRTLGKREEYHLTTHRSTPGNMFTA